MSEIKSTLDLIMEKTKNLSLTQEERQDIHLKELKAKVKGWTQRYLDHHIDVETLQEQLASMPEDQTLALDFFRKAMVAHLDPDGNNKRILSFLQDALGEDIGPLSRQIDSFKAEQKRLKAQYTKEALHELEGKEICGTAVIPNLDQYPPWQGWRSTALESFKQGLDSKEDSPGATRPVVKPTMVSSS